MRVLVDRYRIEDRHGGGGMGSVYSAEDTRLGRKVAVKIMQENLAADPRFVERFRREARAAASLSHPNIAAVYDYGDDDGSEFIVMELVPGRDLAQLLREEGPLQPERAAAIAEQIALALGHAHSAGVVHRDVKPGNVLVDNDDHVKVTDFGIARAAGDSTLTASGAIMGTVHYISPEQAAGTPTQPASDVYSLGIVLYEMLTGSVPFTADSAVGIAMRHLDDEVPAPSDLDPSIPEWLDRIVEVATAKAPENRFRDGAEMAAAVAERSVPATVAAVPQTAVLGGGGAGGTQVLTGSWDPNRVGRTALLLLAALGIAAIASVLVRVAQNAEGGRDRTRGQGQAPAAEEPVETTAAPEEDPNETEPEGTAGYQIPEDIIGGNYKDWHSVLKDAGLEVQVEKLHDDEPKDTIIDVDPDPGSAVSPGDTVTLTVSQGDHPNKDEEDD